MHKVSLIWAIIIISFGLLNARDEIIVIESPGVGQPIAGKKIVINGLSSVACGIVRIYINNVETKQVRADSRGLWTHTYDYLESGNYEIRVVLQDNSFCTLANAVQKITVLNSEKESRIVQITKKIVQKKKKICGLLDPQKNGSGAAYSYEVNNRHITVKFNQAFSELPLILFSAQGSSGKAGATIIGLTQQSVDILCNEHTEKVHFYAQTP